MSSRTKTLARAEGSPLSRLNMSAALRPRKNAWRKQRRERTLAKLFSSNTYAAAVISPHWDIAYVVITLLKRVVALRSVYRVRYSSRRATSVTKASPSRTASTTGLMVMVEEEASAVTHVPQGNRLAATGYVHTCAYRILSRLLSHCRRTIHLFVIPPLKLTYRAIAAGGPARSFDAIDWTARPTCEVQDGELCKASGLLQVQGSERP